jgi:hypothetical protein
MNIFLLCRYSRRGTTDTVVAKNKLNFSPRKFLPILATFKQRFKGQILLHWDRCYDFLNIFAEKFSEKMAFLTQNKAKL